jgi:hypothetical protein
LFVNERDAGTGSRHPNLLSGGSINCVQVSLRRTDVNIIVDHKHRRLQKPVAREGPKHVVSVYVARFEHAKRAEGMWTIEKEAFVAGEGGSVLCV